MEYNRFPDWSALNFGISSGNGILYRHARKGPMEQIYLKIGPILPPERTPSE